jgi:hypothetical protein
MAEEASSSGQAWSQQPLGIATQGVQVELDLNLSHWPLHPEFFLSPEEFLSDPLFRQTCP